MRSPASFDGAPRGGGRGHLPDRQDLQREFPELEPEDIREALAHAAANLDDKVIELVTVG